MKLSPRDSQRSRAYRHESQVLAQIKKDTGWKVSIQHILDLKILVRLLWDHMIEEKLIPEDSECPSVEHNTRLRTRSYYSPFKNSIQLKGSMMLDSVTIHETAHAALHAGGIGFQVPWHGKEFLGALYALYSVYCGFDVFEHVNRAMVNNRETVRCLDQFPNFRKYGKLYEAKITCYSDGPHWLKFRGDNEDAVRQYLKTQPKYAVTPKLIIPYPE